MTAEEISERVIGWIKHYSIADKDACEAVDAIYKALKHHDEGRSRTRKPEQWYIDRGICPDDGSYPYSEGGHSLEEYIEFLEQTRVSRK